MFNQCEDMKKLAVKLESPDASSLDSASTVKTEPADVDDVYSLQEKTIVKEEITIEPTVIRPHDVVYNMQQPCKQELVHNTPTVASCSVDPQNDCASDSPYLTLSDQAVDYNNRAYEKIQTNRVLPFNCEICNRYFPLPSSLATHMKFHTREQYHCEVCKKRFTQHADFIMHTSFKPKGRVSCGSPYNCEVCYQRFKTSVTLKKHLRTHSGEGRIKRQIKCKLCKKCFTKNGYLTKHMKNMHK